MSHRALIQGFSFIALALIIIFIDTHSPASSWTHSLQQARRYHIVRDDSSFNYTQTVLPTTKGQFKLIGPDKGRLSLMTKLQMIRRAKYTLDIGYYILKRDISAYSLLHEVCKAIERGVDVRILIDSLGSIHHFHGELKALSYCPRGLMLDESGRHNRENIRSKVQSVVFNSLFHPIGDLLDLIRGLGRVIKNIAQQKTNNRPFKNWANRRMHDKIILIDGRIPEFAMGLIGGRNISINYYNIDKEGRAQNETYQDIEILFKNAERGTVDNHQQLGAIVSDYFDILFTHIGNKKLVLNIPLFTGRHLNIMKSKHHQLLNAPGGRKTYNEAYEFLDSNFIEAEGRWLHETYNLFKRRHLARALDDASDSKDTLPYVAEQENASSNSIYHFMRNAMLTSQKRLVIISPYLFFNKQINANMPFFDHVNEYALIQEWLGGDSERVVEIITNSVLTSDNFFAQAIIDQEVFPQLMTFQEENFSLIPEFRELAPKIMSQDEWNQIIDEGRIQIWEYGQMDSVQLGGDLAYGKLHIKTSVIDSDTIMITTSNLDFRSRHYNTESGLAIFNPQLVAQFEKDIEELKSHSLLWGSPEWKQVRKEVAQKGGIRSLSVKHQKAIYQLLSASGLRWLF